MPSTLWVAGAAGVGKSVTAWQAFCTAPADAAYVDVDQVGMLYPDVEHDEFGFQLKNDAIRALLANYAEAKVESVLVSGVIDPTPGEGGHRMRLPGLEYCLLTVNDALLRERVLARGWDVSDAHEVVAEQAALVELAFADRNIDATNLSISDAAQLVLSDFVPGSDEAGDSLVGQRPESVRRPVRQVLVVGARVTGCSSVGFGLARDSWSAGVRTGFADLQQLSFCRSTASASLHNSDLGVENAVALSSVFAAHGAERFVLNGHPRDGKQVEALRHQNPNTLVVRLRASPESIKSHIATRVGGDREARLIGDDLAEATAMHQDEVWHEALRHQQAMDDAGIGDMVLNVDEIPTDELIAAIAAKAWQ